MKPNQTVCTTGGKGWCAGGTTGSGIDGYQISLFRHHDGIRNERTGFNFKTQRAEADGMIVADAEEAEAYKLLHGFVTHYSRNTCGFVSSRAYRKHTRRLRMDDGRGFSVYDSRRRDADSQRVYYHTDGTKVIFESDGRARFGKAWRDAGRIASELGLREQRGAAFTDYYATQDWITENTRPLRQPKI